MADFTFAEDYEAAVRIVTETRRCSTSWLQRKLPTGYERAAKIVALMERRGVIGPATHEVLVPAACATR